MVCQEYHHSTRAGIFGTENNYSVTRHTGYGYLQLNYHEGENLSPLGDTLFGSIWVGADLLSHAPCAGLFYLWHSGVHTSHVLFGSLSQ